jgi:hypothetical protein
MNEYEEIRGLYLVQSTAFKYIELPLQNLFSTMKMRDALSLIKAFFTDNCCQERSFLEKNLPDLRVDTAQLPILPMSLDDITLVDSRQADIILANTFFPDGLDPINTVHIGFDIEWPFQKNSHGNGGQTTGKVALVQIAMMDNHVLNDASELRPRVFLFWLQKFLIGDNPAFPSTLRRILECEKYVKVGRMPLGDAARLEKDFPSSSLKITSCVDILPICQAKNLVGNRSNSLRNMTQKVLSYDLDKNDSLRMQDWSDLSKAVPSQLYAARDAKAGLLIYLKALGIEMIPFVLPNHSYQVDVSEKSAVLPEIHQDDSDISPILLSPDAPGLQNPLTRVLLDLFHAFQRVLDEVSKKSALAIEFSRRLRDAVMLIYQVDRKLLEKYLVDENIRNIRGELMTFEELFDSNPRFVLKRCRRYVPQPAVLEQNIKNVIGQFEQIDAELKTNFRSPRFSKAIDGLLSHVRNGCLSDPPGLNLYLPQGKDKYGLTIYHCIRGTNDLEGGIHQKLSMKVQMFNAGERLMHAMLLYFAHRYNIRASAKYRPLFPAFGHYDTGLIDQLFHIGYRIYGRASFSWWDNGNCIWNPEEKFGIIPLLPKPSLEAPPSMLRDWTPGYSFPEKMSNTAKFVAQRQESTIPITPIITRKERRMFAHSISNYSNPSTLRITNSKLAQMADDWNQGTLKLDTSYFNANDPDDKLQAPDGIHINRKLVEHLRQYFSAFIKASQQSNVRANARKGLGMISSQISSSRQFITEQNQAEMNKLRDFIVSIPIEAFIESEKNPQDPIADAMYRSIFGGAFDDGSLLAQEVMASGMLFNYQSLIKRPVSRYATKYFWIQRR